MKGKSISHTFNYKDIIGITISKSSSEFIFHLNYEEDDYYFTCKNRDLFISQLSKLYHSNTNKILKLFIVRKKNPKNTPNNGYIALKSPKTNPVKSLLIYSIII